MTEVPTQPGSSWPACHGGPCSIMQPFPTTKLLIKPQFLHWLPYPVARCMMGRNTGLTNKHYVMAVMVIFVWLVNHWITIKVLSRFWHHPGGFGECWMDLDGLSSSLLTMQKGELEKLPRLREWCEWGTPHGQHGFPNSFPPPLWLLCQVTFRVRSKWVESPETQWWQRRNRKTYYYYYYYK